VLEISSLAVTGVRGKYEKGEWGGKPMDPTTFVVDEIGRSRSRLCS